MFDIGGWEFLIVIVIAIIVIGPKDLPGTIRTVTGWIRRARELAREFQSGLEDLARETDMDKVKDDIQSGLGLDEFSGTSNSIRNKIEDTIDPDGTVKHAFDDSDGPFADNSFEEDEDIDGAGHPDIGDAADAVLDTDPPLAATDEPKPKKTAEESDKAVKKAET